MAKESRRLFDASKPPLKRLTAASVRASGEQPAHVGAPLAKSEVETGDLMTRHYQNTELDWSEFDSPDDLAAPVPLHGAPQNVSQPIAKSDDTIVRHYQNTELDWSEFDPPEPDQATSPARIAAQVEMQKAEGSGSGSGLVDMIQRIQAQAAPPPQQPPNDAQLQQLLAGPRMTEHYGVGPSTPMTLPLAKADGSLADTFGELSQALGQASAMVANLQKSQHVARAHPQLLAAPMTAAQARQLGRHAVMAPDTEPMHKSDEFDEMLRAVQDATEAFAVKGLI